MQKFTLQVRRNLRKDILIFIRVSGETTFSYATTKINLEYFMGLKKKSTSIVLKAPLLRKALLKFHELIMELERDDFSFI